MPGGNASLAAGVVLLFWDRKKKKVKSIFVKSKIGLPFGGHILIMIFDKVLLGMLTLVLLFAIPKEIFMEYLNFRAPPFPMVLFGRSESILLCIDIFGEFHHFISGRL